MSTPSREIRESRRDAETLRQGREALTLPGLPHEWRKAATIDIANRPRTAESLAYVGFWRRSWATLIDSLLLAIIVQPILMMFSSGSPSVGPLEILLGLVLPSIGTVLLWRYKLATPGKMLFRARVVDASTGGTPSMGQLVGRYFGYLLSTIPLGLGFLWVGWDPRKQGWHDKLAGTVVVARKHHAPDPVQFPASN